jgi:DHA2 family multidrug resistance protein
MSQSSTQTISPAMSPLFRLVVTICTMLAVVMQGVDTTIANVALPYMQGAMSASQEQIDWVLTSYIVAAAIMTAPTGYLAGRFGRTRMFVTATGGFTIASVLCGMAQSLDQVVLFRVLQGIFGAGLIPLSQVVLTDIYPPEDRGAAMGVWTMGVMMGPIIGPTLGGYLTAHYSWRSVFYVNVPFGLAAALGMLLCLPESGVRRNLKLDWLGFASLSLAVGMFQTVLDRGETLDWFSSKEIILETFLGAIGFYIFMVQFMFGPKPFITPRLFADVNFVVGIIFIFLVSSTLYATLSLLAPYVQDLMNYPVSTAGLVLAPRGVGSMISAFICGRAIKTVGTRNMAAIGFVIACYAEYCMIYWTPDVSVATIVIVGFIQGIGITFITVPISTIIYATLPAELRTEGSGVFNLFRTMGGAIGISVSSALLEINSQINHADISGAVTPFNRGLASGAPVQFWNPLHPGGAMALNSEITRQGTIIAYSDDFKLMLFLTLITMPVLLLIRAPAKRKSAEAAASPASLPAKV